MRFTLFYTAVLLAIFSLSAFKAVSHSHGILHTGRRRLSNIPESFTTEQLAYLISSGIGHPKRSLQENFLKQDAELLKLTSNIVEDSGFIILGFLPSNGESLPPGIFNDSSSPFNIDHDSPNCSTNDLKCIRNSILEFHIDKQSELVLINQGVELVQWAGKPSKNVDIAKEMIDAIKPVLDSHDSDILKYLKQVSQLPTLPQISIDEKKETFTIHQATFQFNDACALELIAEALGLQAVQSHVPELITFEPGHQVIVLSPTRAIQCFVDTKAPTIQVSAAQVLLLKLIEQIITTANDATDGNVFSLIVFNDADESSPIPMNSDGIAKPVSFADRKEFHVAEVEPSSVSMIEVYARRRRLQSTDKSKMQAPRMVVLWLCIILVFALVFAIVPLLSLSTINDPIISTKLFTPSHHA